MAEISELLSAVDMAVLANEAEITETTLKLWELSETSLNEIESSKLLMEKLRNHGFTITSEGTSHIPTAFIAEWGGEGPILGVLLEYDALPQLGNKAVCHKEARDDGKLDGHGCGHNIIGASSLGAAIAIKEIMETQGIAGKLRVYGCAAEETEGAKVYMARDGLFDDLDVCIHNHPFECGMVANISTTAVDQMRIEFLGRTAHAGNTPWLGRSAVHAAELFTHGINLMREHLEPTARVHYVYESAGTAPNVVPDYAKIWLMSRDYNRDHVNKTSAWIKGIAEGAALATQTTAKVDLFFGIYDVLPNTPLAKRMQAHFERIGIPKWTDDEQAFARELQKAFDVAEKGMAQNVMPMPEEPKMGGASDVGDVSYNTPTMGITMPTVPVGVSLHTWAATAVHGMSIGTRCAVQTARVLAAMGIDALTDADLRKAAREDFVRRTEGTTFTSALPSDRIEPSAMPDWMLHGDGSREMMA